MNITSFALKNDKVTIVFSILKSVVASPKKRVVHCYEKTYTHNSTFYFKIIHQKTYSSPPKMSNPVEKNLNMKNIKVRGSVLRLLDADFKIL